MAATIHLLAAWAPIRSCSALADVANTVTITDFAAEDRFGITASDYGLSQGRGLVDNGSGVLVLDPAWFATVTGTQGTVAGHGQFLYSSTTSTVTWDPDGSGAVTGTALAKLQQGAVVTASNFAISGGSSAPGSAISRSTTSPSPRAMPGPRLPPSR